MMKIRNFFRHLNTVNKHRFLVFKYSIKAGIPFRGLVHDLSKYSITEFFEEELNTIMETLVPLEIVKKKMDIQKHIFIIKEEINIILNTGMILIVLLKHL